MNSVTSKEKKIEPRQIRFRSAKVFRNNVDITKQKQMTSLKPKFRWIETRRSQCKNHVNVCYFVVFSYALRGRFLLTSS